MFRVELGGDDFDGNGDAVKVANVAHAIAKLLLANGNANKFQAERDAWPHIITGITAGKLHPFNPATLDKLTSDNCTDGVVRFDELVAWGQWCKRFNFVKQAAPAAKADETQALIASRKARLERAITPQGSGCAPRYSPPPITVKPPKWEYWRHMPTVAPWEACALALNIEPDSVDYRPESWDGQPETWRGFPSDEIGDHFIKLLRLLNSNQFESQHFTENFSMGVRLPEFAVWCAPIVRDLIGSDIPKELAAMAKDAPQVAPTPNAEEVTVGSPSGDNMEEQPAAKGKDTTPAPAEVEAVPVASQSSDAAAKVEAVAGTMTAPAIKTNKLRRNNLDPAIEKAIKQAGNMELADVYLKLKELALSEEKPFTGTLDGDALCYTNDNNDPAKLSKEALGKRLKNRR